MCGHLCKAFKVSTYLHNLINIQISNIHRTVFIICRLNKKSNIKGQTQQVTVNIDDGDDEGLALLIPDIQETTVLVQKTTQRSGQQQQNQSNATNESGQLVDFDRPIQSKSIEERYLEVMKKLQFDTFDMIVEAESNGYRFVVSHHFEKMVRMAGDRYHPSRVKRLAQEAVTLSTSLPLSFSSSVFVRCDTDRLDVMKVSKLKLFYEI